MITEILSGLWIGTIEELANIQFLNDTKISIIINCTESHHMVTTYECQKIRIPVSELNEPSRDFPLLKQNLSKILQFIHTNIDEKNIVIFGYKNLIIPEIIVSAYMIHYGNINKENIPDILRSKNTQLQLTCDLSYFL